MTALSRRGIVQYKFWIAASGIAKNMFWNRWYKSDGVVQLLIFFRSLNLVSRHKFSIKFKSGDWGGQTDVFTELQSSQVLVSADTCTGALSWTNV